MSLINKMLKDLETRQSGLRQPDPRSIYQGLRAPGRPPVKRRLLGAVILTGVALAGYGGWLGWQHLDQGVPEGAVPPTVAVAPSDEIPQASPVAKSRKAAASSRPKRPMAAPVKNPDTATAAIELSSRPLTSIDQAENKYREAIQLVRQSRPGDAEMRLRAALALNPAHVHARESLAALLVEQGRWLEAQALLEEGLKILPNQVSFGFLLARLYVEQGKDAAGLQLLERLQPYSGNNPEFLAFMATLYQRTGQHSEAVNYFRQVMLVRPEEGRWWVALGISLEAGSDREAARAAYQRANALPLDPRLAEYVADRLKQLPNR